MRDPWGGRANPHIDDVMMGLTGRQLDGVIMFSGGSTDGLKGAQALRRMGVRIWAQEPDTATEPALPKWVDRLFLASKVASPSELAEDFLMFHAGVDGEAVLKEAIAAEEFATLPNIPGGDKRVLSA